AILYACHHELVNGWRSQLLLCRRTDARNAALGSSARAKTSTEKQFCSLAFNDGGLVTLSRPRSSSTLTMATANSGSVTLPILPRPNEVLRSLQDTRSCHRLGRVHGPGTVIRGGRSHILQSARSPRAPPSRWRDDPCRAARRTDPNRLPSDGGRYSSASPG